jgi:hypothetical protein
MQQSSSVIEAADTAPLQDELDRPFGVLQTLSKREMQF